MGRTVLTMLEALACRGPDSVGAAVIDPRQSGEDGVWSVRISPADEGPLAKLAGLGQLIEYEEEPWERSGDTLRFDFRPGPM